MSAIQITIKQLRENIDNLSAAVEKLLDERSELQTKLKKRHIRSHANRADDHLQKDWLDDA